jgi:arylsulfatase A-like enzyme
VRFPATVNPAKDSRRQGRKSKTKEEVTMNIILIVSDTFRRDHLGCYGNNWIRTPNLDRLARESTVFDQAYTGSFPTIPHRKDLFTGKWTFTYCDWSPLGREETILAQCLADKGYLTQMVVDTYHLIKDGFSYDRGFHGWIWHRGQEGDRYSTSPAEPPIPKSRKQVEWLLRAVARQYAKNVSLRVHEQDYFAPKTLSEARRWLERNYKHKPFFLYVDTFDPHEPWDPPRWYADLYCPGYDGLDIIQPPYGPCDFLTRAEIRRMRALYAGEATMVDRWVGFLLQAVEDMGLLEDTLIVFTTDHGFLLGEHGLITKAGVMYEEIVHIPLLLRLPAQRRGARVSAYVQPADLMPTLLELAGAPDPGTMHGKSLLPLLTGKAKANRDFAVSSSAIIHPLQRPKDGTRHALRQLRNSFWLRPSVIRTGRWWLTITQVEGIGCELYDMRSDPGQKRNLARRHPEVARRLHRKYLRFLESLGADPAYLEPRRELVF